MFFLLFFRQHLLFLPISLSETKPRCLQALNDVAVVYFIIFFCFSFCFFPLVLQLHNRQRVQWGSLQSLRFTAQRQRQIKIDNWKKWQHKYLQEAQQMQHTECQRQGEEGEMQLDTEISIHLLYVKQLHIHRHTHTHTHTPCSSGKHPKWWGRKMFAHASFTCVYLYAALRCVRMPSSLSPRGDIMNYRPGPGPGSAWPVSQNPVRKNRICSYIQQLLRDALYK